ncbi:hypothetical protein NLC29_02100 [Candidatus Aminicenantes bacterium AH-873-B07]|jgi:hypothetical protein|nr:hypothetical protein [Candidatus Aminicenantes bacterium AH-873-B07]
MKFIKPFISKQEAYKLFSKKKKIFLKKSKIEKLELVYLPYYLFKLTVNFPDGEKEIFAASDGIEGSFAYWSEKSIKFSRDGEGFVFDFIIDSNKAKEKIEEEYRSILLLYNLKKKRNAWLNEIKKIDKFYYPYWIIYYRKRISYDFKILDAVSGEIQGIKMKRIFLIALNQDYKSFSKNKNRGNT